MQVLENERLRIQIADRGAELSAVYDKTHGRDVLWCADPAHWDRHAPLLFPFVGRVIDGVYRYRGQTYAMQQHGFAQDMPFACVQAGPDAVVHRLTDTPETRAIYPFPFVLTVTHTLHGGEIHVDWKVENPAQDDLYFSIGGHPAFCCPVLPGTRQTDYFVSFPGKDELVCSSVDTRTGTVDTARAFTLRTENGRLPITPHTFDHDALVFDAGQVQEVGLLFPDGSPYITLRCPGFPSLGVWTRPNNTAPFVCLEPWIGRCDDVGFAGEMTEKYGMQHLPPHGVFTAGYTITVEP